MKNCTQQVHVPTSYDNVPIVWFCSFFCELLVQIFTDRFYLQQPFFLISDLYNRDELLLVIYTLARFTENLSNLSKQKEIKKKFMQRFDRIFAHL